MLPAEASTSGRFGRPVTCFFSSSFGDCLDSFRVGTNTQMSKNDLKAAALESVYLGLWAHFSGGLDDHGNNVTRESLVL